MFKVLVVDDDDDVRELCRIVLANEGYAVLEAEDGPTGVCLAREEQPDLILLDWMMPEVDGMDALLSLKGSARTRKIPVVMLTALDGLPQVTMATLIGAEGYLTKPFEVDDLLSFVRRFLAPPVPAGGGSRP
jgi:DNA-binding response OmpR family regulator